MTSKKQLQHSISRTLTKRWQKDGQMWIYSHLSGKLNKENYKALFAENNVWDPSYETLFKESFEDDFDKLIEKLKHKDKIENWKDYELLLNLFLIHIARVGKTYFGHNTLESIVKKCSTGEAKLDKVFEKLRNEVFSKHESLIVIKSPLNLPYFLTESLVFPYPVMCKSGFLEISYAMAIEPKMLLAMVPKEFNVNYMKYIINDPTLFEFSLGLGSLDKVGIHEEVMFMNSNNKDLVISSIKKTIDNNVIRTEAMKKIENFGKFFDKAFEDVLKT